MPSIAAKSLSLSLSLFDNPQKACLLLWPVPWNLSHCWTGYLQSSLLFTLPWRKSQRPDNSESLLLLSPAVIPHHSLSFWPHTELLSWSWGPPSCQLLISYVTLKWQRKWLSPTQLPQLWVWEACLSQVLGALSLLGLAGAGRPWGLCHVAPDPGRWIFFLRGKPAGLRFTDLQPLFSHQLGRQGLWVQHCHLCLVEQCVFSFKQPTGATFPEMKGEKTVRLPARNI